MRLAIGTLLIAATLLALVGPGRAADGEAGGLARNCRSLADGEAKRFIDDVSKMTREQLLPNMQAVLGSQYAAFLELSDVDQDAILQQLRDSLINLPSVTLSFCDHLARGAVPGIGPDTGHGSLAVAWEFRFDIAGKAREFRPGPGAGDCALPYSITVEQDSGTTKHIFCEAAAGFALTSSHRADGADRWTRIE